MPWDPRLYPNGNPANGLIAAMNAQAARASGISERYRKDALADVDQLGAGQHRQIEDNYRIALGNTLGRYQSRGLGNSVLQGGAQRAATDRKSAAQLNLQDMLLGQRLGVHSNTAQFALQGLNSLRGNSYYAGGRNSGVQRLASTGNNYGYGASAYGGLSPEDLLRARYEQFWSQGNAGILAKPQMNLY